MANAIQYWRKKYKNGDKEGMSQQKLADLVGIDRPTLSKIENENILIDPSEEMAEKIARILKVLPTDILRRASDEKE